MGVTLLWPVIAAAASAGAFALTPAPRDNSETIVVTGERVKRTLKETPSSVVVFRSEDIDRLAAPDRLAELLELNFERPRRNHGATPQ